VSYYSIYY